MPFSSTRFERAAPTATRSPLCWSMVMRSARIAVSTLPERRVARVDGLAGAALVLERVGVDVGRLLVLEQAREPRTARRGCAAAAARPGRTTRSQRRLDAADGAHPALLERHVDALLRLDRDLLIGHARRTARVGAGDPQRALVGSYRASPPDACSPCSSNVTRPVNTALPMASSSSVTRSASRPRHARRRAPLRLPRDTRRCR